LKDEQISHPLNFLLRDGSSGRHFRGIPSFKSQDRNQEHPLSEEEQQAQFRDLTPITLRSPRNFQNIELECIEDIFKRQVNPLTSNYLSAD
jgi:hypothetical protein